MNKSIILALSLAMLGMTSCSDFTDVQPKGANLLTKTTDLEMLLNYEYGYGYNSNMISWSISDFQAIGSDSFYYYSYLSTLLALPTKSKNQIMLTWDVAGHANELLSLTTSDAFYSGCYSVIGTVANPILQQVDGATGTQAERDAIKAEALTLRAYFHYIAVNRFAAAYNASTAATTPGIAYMKEDQDLLTPADQLTVQEIYDNIIADIDAAIALDALPLEATNRARVNKPFSYAVKAMALMSMQKPQEAAAVAKQAIALSPAVSDYNNLLETVYSYMGTPYEALVLPKLGLEEDYFASCDYNYFMLLFPECIANFEPEHISYEKVGKLSDNDDLS